MALLSQPAIDTLARLANAQPGWWTAASELDYHACAELEQAGLVEVSRPPMRVGRPAWTAPTRPQPTRVRVTERGRERLAQIRPGARLDAISWRGPAAAEGSPERREARRRLLRMAKRQIGMLGRSRREWVDGVAKHAPQLVDAVGGLDEVIRIATLAANALR